MVGMADTIKLIFAASLVLGAMAAFYIFNEHSVFLRTLGVVVVFGAALAVGLQTASGKRAWEFIKDSYTEVRKVVWPTRKETVNTTLVVVAVAIVVAIFLWILDMGLIWSVKQLTGQGA